MPAKRPRERRRAWRRWRASSLFPPLLLAATSAAVLAVALFTASQAGAVFVTGVTTTLSPASPVTIGTSVTDSAQLVGTNVQYFTGTISYAVYSDANCSVLVASLGTFPVTNGSSLASSNAWVASAAGNYWFQATFSDPQDNNLNISSVCTSEEMVVIGTSGPSGPSSSTSTTVAPSTSSTTTPPTPTTSVTTSTVPRSTTTTTTTTSTPPGSTTTTSLVPKGAPPTGGGGTAGMRDAPLLWAGSIGLFVSAASLGFGALRRRGFRRQAS